VEGHRNNIFGFAGSQVVPACPSDRGEALFRINSKILIVMLME
jgi:hypothetical protein